MPETNSARTNGAKRLLLSLRAMQTVPHLYQQGGTQFARSGLDALPLALNLSPDERLDSKSWELMRSIKMVTEMVADLRQEVDSTDLVDEDKQFYLRDLPNVTNIFAPGSLVRGWNDVIAAVTPQMIANFEHLDRVLNRRSQERDLSADDFGPFLAEIDGALIELGQLEIDVSLKELIASQLREIKLAIDEYRFRGVKGLQPAVAGYIGSLALAHAELAQATTTPEGKIRLKALLDVCKTGADLLNTAKGVAWVWPHLVQGAQVLQHLLAQAAN